MPMSLPSLLREIRACRLCEAVLPLGPRPVLRASASSRVMIVGQAPGLRVHESGVPWADASGKRLREWLQLDEAAFYDERRVAIVPMGFCYPGKKGSGDAPPRPECRATWHPRLLPMLKKVELTLLIGRYAQAYFLDGSDDVTANVRAWKAHLPALLPLPHPSPRNVAWFKANPWFDREVLPVLRRRVKQALS